MQNRSKGVSAHFYHSLSLTIRTLWFAEQESDDGDDVLGLKPQVKRVKREGVLHASTEQLRSERVLDTSSTTAIADADASFDKSTATDRHSMTLEKSLGPKSRVGPVRQAANVRSISRIDYQPDVCKDWKETGFCGYGDACKFMHDRGDYKLGWQLDKEWDEQQKRKRQGGGDAEEDYTIKEDDEDLPFACFICRQEFTHECSPVVTTCKHYFCEACAFAHFKRTGRCGCCQKRSDGVFRPAPEVLRPPPDAEAPSEESEAS